MLNGKEKPIHIRVANPELRVHDRHGGVVPAFGDDGCVPKRMKRKIISVIVPTLNEEENAADLVRRVHVALSESGFTYEIIVIDDHSTDGTCARFEELGKTYPVFVYLKQGKRGKAYSILEGFEYARFETIAMIDADLQYPPEALPDMLTKLDNGADIVVASRIERETSFLRKVLSRGFALVFSKFLHGLDCDVQSGMKVFRSTVMREVKVTPDPWTFDLEFLLLARNYGYRIASHDIVFAERAHGESKIHFWKAVSEIGWNALKLRLREREPLHLAPTVEDGMIGAGVAHKQKRFITHSTLSHSASALHTFVPWQRNTLLLVAVFFVVGLFIAPLKTIIFVTAVLSFVYFADTVFNLLLVLRSLKRPPELSFLDEELDAMRDEVLPVYSVLCPLYREAHVLPGFLEAIAKMEWPKEKLDVLLLLEENDTETIDAARSMNLPSFVRIVVVPHSEPKTKPKACNYGLSLARGEYVVIYDAEDIPDPKQLKKAFLGFSRLPRNVWCLQAKLNYFNPHQNILTRLFTAEYSLWFDVTLPGLQSVSTSIPLGGTSNHFRREDLLSLEGWDPFNVTEDCDLGTRIFTRGHTTAIIDSVTLEEANSRVGNWLRQRSRWIKGYMQTYLVHMRSPVEFVRKNGIHALLFQMIVGGKIAFMLINPILWIETILYFSLRSVVGPTIETFYPGIVFYMAVISLIFGNFLSIYYYMIGCAKREHWSLMKWVFLIPFYWIMVSIAAIIAAYQLFVKPHYWEKTTHGLHLLTAKKREQEKREKLNNAEVKLEKDSEKEAEPALFSARAVSHTQRAMNVLSRVRMKTRAIRLPAWRFFATYPGIFSFSLSSIRSLTRYGRSFLVSPEGFFVVAMMVANVLNFVFSAVLGRILSFEELGLVTLVSTLWYLALIFISPFTTTINRETAYLSAKKGEQMGLSFWASVMRMGLIASIFATAMWLFVAPALARFFHVPNIFVFLIFAPILASGLVAYGNFGFLQGSLRFRAAASISLFESVSKLVLISGLFFTGRESLAYAVVPVSVVISAALSFIFIPGGFRALSHTEHTFSFPWKFFVATFLMTVSTTLFMTVDVLLAKHFMSERAAGEYALLSIVGKVVLYLGALPGMFLVTFVGRDQGLGKNPKRVFRTIYAFAAGMAFSGVVAFGFLSHIFSRLLFGEKISAVESLLPVYTIAIAVFVLVNTTVTYHLARKRYVFVVASLLMSVAEMVGIILFHWSLEQVVWSVFASSVFGWVLVTMLTFFEPQFRFVSRASRDFLGAFRDKVPEVPVLPGKKRVLVFNWRDSRHVYGGGAEVYVEEIAKRWVAGGHSVTLFCGNDGKSPRHEIRDGIRIIRRGGFYLVYAWAFVYYFARFRGKYDVILDCENGIPFFTPLYVQEPVVCLLHHVHQDVFYRFLPRPLAWLASFLERKLMPFVYVRVPFVTVSQSSREDMDRLSIGKAGISVVHPGVSLEFFTKGEKERRPFILYLGRLKEYKSVDVLLSAFRKVIGEHPEAELVIAGSGDDEKRLKHIAFKELRLGSERVKFVGYVSEEEKRSLLQRAWMLVNPSMMEGWGIVSIEANACGTPVVASNVPGLRDSVKNLHSGFLVPYGDAEAFAERILEIIRNRNLRDTFTYSAREWAEEFDWDISSRKMFNTLFPEEIGEEMEKNEELQFMKSVH